MKKYIIFFLFFFYSILSHSQSFNVVLVDSETKNPVAHTVLTTEDKSFSTVSNDLGEILLPESLLHKKIYIDDYLYFKESKIFTEVKKYVWEIKPNSETLEEIIIDENIKLSLQEVIRNSIKSFSENLQLSTYYRENYYNNSSLACFADGMVDFYIDKNTYIQSVIKQSRTKSFAPTSNMNMRTSYSLENIIDATMRFNVIQELLEDKKYDFYVTEKKVGDKTIHTCYFMSKEKVKKRLLRSGYFVYDADKKIILESSFGLDPNKAKYNKALNVVLGKFHISNFESRSKYVDSDGLYYPSFARVKTVGSVNSKLANIDNEKINNEVFFYVLNTRIINKTPTSFSAKGTLYSRGTKYSYPFWDSPEIKHLVK